MKKIILIYGLISGVIVAAMMWLTQPLLRDGTLNLDNGMLIGYTTMVIALSLVFFGIKSCRDQTLGGSITFGVAFKVGILIALIGSLMYAISWEFYYNIIAPDFMEWYTQCQLDKMIKEGKSEMEITRAKDDFVKFGELYKNPLIRFGMTMLEILPVGLIVTLISAGLLRKKEFLASDNQ
jgi:hypothetical protein